MLYQLVVVSPSRLAGKTFPLELPSMVGRSPDHNICIDDETISRTHCKISFNSAESLVVRDLNSLNGTYVNDQRAVRPRVLVPGSTLQLGAITFRVELCRESDPVVPRRFASGQRLNRTAPIRRSEILSAIVVEENRVPVLRKRWWQLWKQPV